MIFVEQSIYNIRTKQGRMVPFVPNTSQKRIIKEIKEFRERGEPVRLNFVKGRQIGGTALMGRLQLSYAMEKENFTGYTIAHRQEAVKKIFANHVKYAFDTLPQTMRDLYKVNKDNVHQLAFEWPSGSISSVQVGQSARSDTIDFLHVSEASYISKDQQKWEELTTGSFEAAAFGDIIMETTARGYDNYYYFTQEILQNKYTKWKVLFLSWLDSEEYVATPYDMNWLEDYNRLARLYNLERDPQAKFDMSIEQFYFYFLKANELKDKVKQEYPLTLDEAFLASSDSLFSTELILEAERGLSEPQIVEGVEIYSQPESGQKYVVGVDPAEGGGGDDSVISVWSITTGEQVAELTTNSEPPEMIAIIAVNLADRYNGAVIGCETNGNGIATMNEIKKLEYPDELIYKRIVQDVTNPRHQRTWKSGWYTDGKTRPIMLSDFRSDFENGFWKPRSKKLLKQMRMFVSRDGKYQAEQGQHDDCVMAAMIARQMQNYVVEFL